MTANIRTQSVEDFQLLEVVITSNRFDGRRNSTFDITPVTTEINIYENINEFYLTGSLMFVDDNNIFSSVDFKGTERVRITFKIPDPAAPNITKNFVINSIVKTQKTNDYVNVILMSIIEDHGFYGELKVFSKVYDGKGENIIQNIVRDQLYKNVYDPIRSTRRDNITTSRESYQSRFRYIVPYITPFQAIKNILDKITTQNGSPYYLYSSLNTDDLIFADLETMLTRTPLNIITPFTYSQSQSNQPDLAANIYQIYSIGDANQEDTLLIGQMGALGAEYSITNITTGEVTTVQYNVEDVYTKLKQQGIIPRTDDNLIDTLFIPDRQLRDPSRITELTSRRFDQVAGETFPYDRSIRGFTEEANTASYILRMNKHSIQQLLLKNAYELLMPGLQFLTRDLRYSVGNQINIAVFENNFFEGKPTSDPDPKRSGNFLITSKRHIFKANPSTHTVVVGCTRISKKVP